VPEILPEHADLADTVRVIDVPHAADGRVLRLLMNADLDEAIGVLTRATGGAEARSEQHYAAAATSEEHWHWRLQMVERIADRLDCARFGVKALYVIGSVKNASAGPSSDIDLLVHVEGSDAQREALLSWLEGWSLALAELNYLRTGYRVGKLLDVRLVTDAEIAAKPDDYVAKIGAVTDAAREIPLKKPS